MDRPEQAQSAEAAPAVDGAQGSDKRLPPAGTSPSPGNKEKDERKVLRVAPGKV